MSIEEILGIIIVTVISGFLAVFFSYTNIHKRKLFVRLCKTKGKWKRNWLIIVILTVLISIYGVWLYRFSYEYIAFMLLAVYLGTITVSDLRSHEIPDENTVVFSILFFLWNLLSKDSFIIFNGVLGAVVGMAIPFVIYFIRRDSIGLGDVKLLGCIGLLLGCPGIIFVLLRAMILGAIYSIGLLLLRKGNLKTELPFAPFVFIAALI